MRIFALFILLLGCINFSSAQEAPQSIKSGPDSGKFRTLQKELYSRVPDFARAAAWIDGARLLEDKENLQLFKDIIPGLAENKFTAGDLAHSYLFFASEDLKVYGAVIEKGKGSLDKLHTLFRTGSSVVKLCFEKNRFLLVIWGTETTSALKLKKHPALLTYLDTKHIISSVGIIKLNKLPGNAPKKMLKEFPEFKHLERVQFDMEKGKRNTCFRFVFDNNNSPRKGFYFFNWGVTLLLWHKTGVFRHIEQTTQQNTLRFALTDPPLGKIAQKMLPAAKNKKKGFSDLQQMKRLLLALHLYTADHQGKFPAALTQLHGTYIPDQTGFIASYDKRKNKGANSSYIYLVPTQDTSLVLLQNPELLPPQKKVLCALRCNGRAVKIKRFLSPRQNPVAFFGVSDAIKE